MSVGRVRHRSGRYGKTTPHPPLQEIPGLIGRGSIPLGQVPLPKQEGPDEWLARKEVVVDIML